MKRTALKPGKGFAASKAQRDKVRLMPCAVCMKDAFEAKIDPAHVYPSGCDDPACVIPLCRLHHSEWDRKTRDLLPDVVGVYVEELQHALGHYEGDVISLLQRLTNERWSPVSSLEHCPATPPREDRC